MAHVTMLSNIGVNVPTAGAVDYGGGATDFALLVLALIAINAGFCGAVKLTAAGAITPPAVGNFTAFLKAGSAAAMTLANPISGAPSAGGQDGLNLTIIAQDAYAYTVTTGTNGLQGTKHIATWTAATGNSIDFVAQGGSWWPVGTPAGVALT